MYNFSRKLASSYNYKFKYISKMINTDSRMISCLIFTKKFTYLNIQISKKLI